MRNRNARRRQSTVSVWSSIANPTVFNSANAGRLFVSNDGSRLLVSPLAKIGAGSTGSLSVLMSQDGGNSFYSLPSIETAAAVCASPDLSTIVALSNGYTVAFTLISYNAGASWTNLPSAFYQYGKYTDCCMSLDGQKILAVYLNNFNAVSNNAGATGSSASIPSVYYPNAVKGSSTLDRVYFVDGNGALLTSLDNGSTVTTINSGSLNFNRSSFPLITDYAARSVLDVSDSGNTAVMIGNSSGADGRVVALSVNQGTATAAFTSDLPLTSVSISGDGLKILATACAANAQPYQGRIHESHDGGITWSTTITTDNIRAGAISADGTKFRAIGTANLYLKNF